MRAFRAPLLALLLGTLGAVLLLEIGVRGLFALHVGPRVMLYGSPWYKRQLSVENAARERALRAEVEREAERYAAQEDRPDSVERHLAGFRLYSKYFPHEQKTTYDVETGARIPVTINSHGLRGEEFEVEKPAGVLRVLTLGASSTFGFYNREDETYPHYLEVELQRRCASTGRRVEVINFAIPHATSYNVAAMFLAEGLALQPDLVSYYQGRNDSVLGDYYLSRSRRVAAALDRHSVLFAMLHQLSREGEMSAAATLDSLARTYDRRAQIYLANIEQIHRACRQRGIAFVVANQQAHGFTQRGRSRQEREHLRGVRYAEETEQIRERLGRGEPIALSARSLLVHEHLMSALEPWAAENGIPFVDVIGALDQDRHLLVSWVHLDPEANRVIADLFARVMAEQLCGSDSE